MAEMHNWKHKGMKIGHRLVKTSRFLWSLLLITISLSLTIRKLTSAWSRISLKWSHIYVHILQENSTGEHTEQCGNGYNCFGTDTFDFKSHPENRYICLGQVEIYEDETWATQTKWINGTLFLPTLFKGYSTVSATMKARKHYIEPHISIQWLRNTCTYYVPSVITRTDKFIVYH